MLPNYHMNISSLEQSSRAGELNDKSVFLQKVDFGPRFSPKTNPNFSTHLSSVKDHTSVYNSAQEETWDAHEPNRNRSIFLRKMKSDYSLLNSSFPPNISWPVNWNRWKLRKKRWPTYPSTSSTTPKLMRCWNWIFRILVKNTQERDLTQMLTSRQNRLYTLHQSAL